MSPEYLSVRFIGAFVLVALAGCGGEGERPMARYAPGMFEPVAYEAYDAAELTPDGKAMMLPPEGTVPYSAVVLLYGPGEEEALRAGRELVNPLPSSEENLARGRHVYDTFCAVCHDARGEGNGPVIGRGRFPNPPSLLASRARNLPDGQVFHILTWGQGVMPDYRVQVGRGDRWRAILYMRQLQGLLEREDPSYAGSSPLAPGDVPTTSAQEESS